MITESAYSRFGGGGGGGGGFGGGGGGGHFGGGSHGGGSGGGSGSIVIMLIVLFVLVIFGLISKQQNRKSSVLNKLPDEDIEDRKNEIEIYLKSNPDFNIENFKTAKVKPAFIELQNAWAKKDVGIIRKYISDGMYQRVATQFRMMNLLDQTNILDNLDVENIVIDKIEQDGQYDIIHAAIQATIVDKYVSKKYPQFNSGGSEEFVEYWSFIRKKGIKEIDLYSNDNCPNCGAALPKNLGEVSRCEFCKTITNLGDYDWVLCEITQAEDYINTSRKQSKSSALASKVLEISRSYNDFSVQNIEDKASNGFLQIISARALNDVTLMRRFVSDELFEKLKAIHGENIVYDRLYLNDVTLVGALQADNKNILAIAVKYSFQRIKITGDTATPIDGFVTSKTEVMMMSRDIASQPAKGSLYAHVCPSCGGPVKDTIDTNCQFCGYLLNSTKNEWIVTDLLSVEEYRNHYDANKEDYVENLDMNLVEGLYDVRDYAFNNILYIMAEDGEFAKEEMMMAVRLAKKWRNFRISDS